MNALKKAMASYVRGSDRISPLYAALTVPCRGDIWKYGWGAHQPFDIFDKRKAREQTSALTLRRPN